MAAEQLCHTCFVACADCLQELRQLVRRNCQQIHASQDCTDSLVMAVNEAVANIISHGYKDRDDGQVELTMSHDQQEVQISLRDQAPHVDLASLQGRDPAEVRPGGLGLFFIRQLMDRVEHPVPPDGQGNVITLVKKKG